MLLWKYFCCLVCLTSSPHLSLGHYNVHSWHLKRQLLIVYQVQPLFISMFLWWNSSERWGKKKEENHSCKESSCVSDDINCMSVLVHGLLIARNFHSLVEYFILQSALSFDYILAFLYEMNESSEEGFWMHSLLLCRNKIW